jgi:hypothetical protein
MGPSVDGIMGLWYFPGRSNVPILNVLKNSSALTQPQVGIWLRDAPTEKNAPGGEITFGGADPNRYSGDISYVNCGGDTPWTVSYEKRAVVFCLCLLQVDGRMAQALGCRKYRHVCPVINVFPS